MKIDPKKVTVGVVVLASLCALTALAAPSGQVPWYSVVPPLVAIVTAFVTQRVMVSLGLAIVIGGVLTELPHLTQGIQPWLAGLFTSLRFISLDFVPFDEAGQWFIPEAVFIVGFVVVIFAMIEILVKGGGFSGVVVMLLRFIKTRRSAEFVTSLLGISCFIDDYTNAIVVGSAMRPITDRYGVSREKLAFLVDATSAPIAGLAVISTWIAVEVGLFNEVAAQLEIGQSGYAMFFDALRYRFYCVFMILFVFLHILFKQDFGPMRSAQRVSLVPGDRDMALSLRQGRARSALVPLAGLIVFHLIALWVAGAGPERLQAGASAANWAYWRDTISAVPSSSRILFYSSCFGLALTCLCVGVWEKLSRPEMLRSAIKGAKKGLLPVMILCLAWALKNCCQALQTGQFLSSLLVGTLSAFWFAPLVFVVASVTSFATGTSYGTMGILIPTAVPVAFALDGNTYGITTVVTLGAVLDGAIFGDHCSPISDTTIISSISTQCDLMQHVRTQMPYSLCVAALAMVCGYLPVVFGMPWFWSIGIALVVMCVLFSLLRRRGESVR